MYDQSMSMRVFIFGISVLAIVAGAALVVVQKVAETGQCVIQFSGYVECARPPAALMWAGIALAAAGLVAVIGAILIEPRKRETPNGLFQQLTPQQAEWMDSARPGFGLRADFPTTPVDLRAYEVDE